MNAPNPKKAYGDKKPALHLLPLAGMIHQSLAHMDGDYKYGFENWNEFPVEKLTYIGAILRHVELYKYGETHARDTGVHNLGAVMACCAILLDAELNGNLIDNAKHSKATCDLLHTAEHIVERLKQAQRDRDAAKSEQANDDLAKIARGINDAWREEKFELLKQDALARAKGLNIDGSPRRETVAAFLVDDAGGDAPAEAVVDICNGCSDRNLCNRMGECLHLEPTHPPVVEVVKEVRKFTTCGKCDDYKECSGANRCFGR